MLGQLGELERKADGVGGRLVEVNVLARTSIGSYM